METDFVQFAEGAEENGLACMLAELIRDNLRERPHKKRDFDALNTRVGIIARDAEVSLTLEFTGGRLTLHDGIKPDATVVIDAEADKITGLSNLNIVHGFPNYFDAPGRQVVKDIFSGKVKIKLKPNLEAGLLHLVDPLVSLHHLTKVMSING